MDGLHCGQCNKCAERQKGFRDAGVRDQNRYLPDRAAISRFADLEPPLTRNHRTMFRVTREIEFCYGHRLLNYEGKCRHLHGHNGRAVITLRGRRA